MIFVESPAFTSRLHLHVDDEEYSVLQALLVENPRIGHVIPACGGIRKLRWGDRSRGKGKRSGARIIYLHIPEADRIDMLLVYGKDESDNLTAEQKRVLTCLALRAKDEAVIWSKRQRRET
jgi:mRNA-degrading endonuclease RelE of RelBE toxin-antitoxin system